MSKPHAKPKRDAILDAALALFVERGFHGTTVPAVTERARVGAGTIYRYFASKEALVNTLFQKWKGEISSHVLVEFPVDADARTQFRALWTRMASFVADNPDAFAFLELHHHGSYLDETSRRIENDLIDFATAFVAKAQQNNELREGPPLLLMSIALGAFTAIVRSSWEKRIELTDRDWDIAEQSCWDAISAREANGSQP